MIVSRRSDGLALVTQTDHQDQCRRMAEAWGGDGFARISDWASLVTAAGVHDAGWAEEDAAPTRDVDGRPLNFTRIDAARHCALYSRGIDAAEALDPVAGDLVSMHGVGLHQHRLGLDRSPANPPPPRPEVRRFVAMEEERQARLRRRFGDDLARSAWRWDAYRLLQAWDSLSLELLWGGLSRGADVTIRSVPTGAGGAVSISFTPIGRVTVRCDPFPFTGSECGLPVPVRRIPDRVYVSDDDLQDAFARAPIEVVDYVICR